MAWEADWAAGSKWRASVGNTKQEENRPLGAFKTANESVSSASTGTTLQNDDELFVSVAASTRYKLSALVMFTSGTTPDFKLDLSLPTSATHYTTAATWSLAAAAGSQLADSRIFTTGASISIPGQGTTFSTQGQLVVLTGYVSVSTTAGEVTIRWAQATSDAGSTTVYANSWLELKRLV